MIAMRIYFDSASRSEHDNKTNNSSGVPADSD